MIMAVVESESFLRAIVDVSRSIILLKCLVLENSGGLHIFTAYNLLFIMLDIDQVIE